MPLEFFHIGPDVYRSINHPHLVDKVWTYLEITPLPLLIKVPAHSLLILPPMPSRSSILLIDDSPGECELFRQALAQAGCDTVLYPERDGDAALHFLRDHQGALPSLILLDWHLRNGNGSAFLKPLRSNSRFTTIPVVVFTTSDDASDFFTACTHGANGYVVKPGTFDELIRFVSDLCRYWLKWNRTLSMVGAGS